MDMTEAAHGKLTVEASSDTESTVV
jgi:hypothetical protein